MCQRWNLACLDKLMCWIRKMWNYRFPISAKNVTKSIISPLPFMCQRWNLACRCNLMCWIRKMWNYWFPISATTKKITFYIISLLPFMLQSSKLVCIDNKMCSIRKILNYRFPISTKKVLEYRLYLGSHWCYTLENWHACTTWCAESEKCEIIDFQYIDFQ